MSKIRWLGLAALALQLILSSGCALDVIVNCDTDADCDIGSICGLSSGLPGDLMIIACVESPGPRCETNTDCAGHDPYLRCAPHRRIADLVCLVPCTDDSDCPTGEICVGETCHVGCRLDADCSSGHHPVCASYGLCSACRTDLDCPSGLHCQDEYRCVECTEHHQCGTGGFCSHTQTCGSCNDDHDCGPGEMCNSGTCEAGCSTHADCPAGSLCPAGGGRCVQACCTHDDCEPGDSCSQYGLCESTCTSDSDCGYVLRALETCSSAGTCEQACTYDSTCGGGLEDREQCSPDGICVLSTGLCCLVEGGCYGPFENGCGGSPNGVTVWCKSTCCTAAQASGFTGLTSAPDGFVERRLVPSAYVYGQQLEVAVRFDSKAPGASSAQNANFTIRSGELETYRVELTYPAEFAFNGFTSLGGPDHEVATCEFDPSLVNLPVRITFPLRAIDADSAYGDLDRNGTYSPAIDALLTHELAGGHKFTLVLPKGGDRSALTRVGVLDGVVSMVLNEGLFDNPRSPGTYAVSVQLTSVDPDTGDADDSAGDPPLVSSGMVPVVISKCGDVNGDDSITAADALAALRMAVGLFASDAICDVVPSGSPDGKVTAADALSLLQSAVGSSAPPSVCGPLART